MWINRTTEQVARNISDLQTQQPNVSFPHGTPISVDMADALGYDPVTLVTPDYDPLTHTATEMPPVRVDGQWTQVWQITPLTQEQIDAATANQANSIRAQRDQLLAQSDWTQVADAPVDQAAWAVYRQALRDVPEQAGFPFNVVWPVKPE